MAQADAVQTAPINITGFGEPTQYPNQPVTSGIDRGAGPGSEALSPTFADPRASYGALTDLLAQLSASDVSGTIAALAAEARSRGI